ncbi:single-stranded DNA-binding protein, partial [Escherichia coli]|nr:single-stranded DNA-binding protein [Escherichia coli]
GFQMISRSERLTVTTAPSCAGHHRRDEDERIFQNTSGAA